MEIISNNDGIVRLSRNELDALSKVNQLNPQIDIVPGLRIAELLYRGKMKSNDMMGIFAELFGASVEHATSIINAGDIARGRSLALRNFDGDDDAVEEAYENNKDLHETVERVRRIKATDPGLEFAPIRHEDAERMADSEVLDWHRIVMQSALILQDNIMRRTNVTPGFLEQLQEYRAKHGYAYGATAPAADVNVEKAFAEVAPKAARKRKPAARKRK